MNQKMQALVVALAVEKQRSKGFIRRKRRIVHFYMGR
jgi:hypothetical protein